MWMSKVWLITGCSAGGIGEGIARCALAKGDKVAVTARSLEKVQGVLDDYPDTACGIVLDITDPASIEDAVAKTVEVFGTIDVLVNNAGYAYRSSIEEAEEAGMRLMYETNLFGPIRLIQKVLPIMREKKSGAIVNVSSIGAVRTGAASGFYASSKAALELMSDGLRGEVGPLGIKVMVVEPGAFRTHFYDSSLKGSDNTIDAYKDTAHLRSVAQNVNKRQQPGDPLKAGILIIEALESDNTPFRLLLGTDAVKVVRGALSGRLQEIDAWETASVKTDF